VRFFLLKTANRSLFGRNKPYATASLVAEAPWQMSGAPWYAPTRGLPNLVKNRGTVRWPSQHGALGIAARCVDHRGTVRFRARHGAT